MKKKIVLILLTLVYTISLAAQSFDVKAINFIHIDTDGNYINPIGGNGVVLVTEINTRGNEVTKEWPTPRALSPENLDYKNYFLKNAILKKIIEKTPPVGYKPSHRVMMRFYDEQGRMVVTKNKAVLNGVIEWDPKTEPPYFTITFFNECIDNSCGKKPVITKPTPFNIRYEIKDGHYDDSNMGKNVGNSISANYQAVRVGEYYWMNSNFKHREPKRKHWGKLVSGDESSQNTSNNPDLEVAKQDNSLKIGRFEKYMNLLELKGFNITVDQFIETYGQYYSPSSSKYMDVFGKIYEKNSTSPHTGWGLPYIEDFRQLVAMAPFNETEGTHTNMNERDFRFAFSAKKDFSAATKMRPYGQCGGHGTYWFDQNANHYGLNMTPNGARVNGHVQNKVEPGNENMKVRFCGKDVYMKPFKGDLYHLFYTIKYPTKPKGGWGNNIWDLQFGNAFSLHDAIDTDVLEGSSKNPYSYHWFPIRWCRRLTDAELGYKIFIKVNNLSTTSLEWTELKNGNDIPLLKRFINNRNLNRNDILIKYIEGANATAPSGYIELPHGYLRGFYVQNRVPKYETYMANMSDATVVEYALGVEDAALGYNPPYDTGLNARGIASSLVVKTATSETVVEKLTSLYPNPATDILNIKTPIPVKSLKIYSIMGAEVLSINNATDPIDIAQLSSGTYIVSIYLTDGSRENHKLIKK